MQVDGEPSDRGGKCMSMEPVCGMDTENKAWNREVNKAWLEQCERWKVKVQEG